MIPQQRQLNDSWTVRTKKPSLRKVGLKWSPMIGPAGFVHFEVQAGF